MGAAGHDRVTVPLGELHQDANQLDQIPTEDGVRGPELQHHPGVHDVLGCRAPVDPAAVVAAVPRELPYERHDRVRGHRQVALDRFEIQRLDAGGGRDRVGGGGWDEAEGGLRLRQGRLHVEPPLEHRSFVEDGAHLRRRELVAEQLEVDDVARHARFGVRP